MSKKKKKENVSDVEQEQMELYKQHRPKTFKGVYGQDTAIKSLNQMLESNSLPHSILFSGPSGCGKTTLARIVAKQLNCGKHDFNEINSASFRGIDMVREIGKQINMRAISGPCRVWLIDECHMLSKDAENAFLKILEDTPRHVYFMLATTERQKVLPAILTRCTEIALGDLSVDDLESTLFDIIEKSKITIPKKVVSAIAEQSNGSARTALVILHQIKDLNESDMLKTIQSYMEALKNADDIVKLLMSPKCSWEKMSALLCDLNLSKEAETVRRRVLGYATSVLLRNKNKAIQSRAFLIIEAFKEHFYDSNAAGVVHACYLIINGDD